MKRRELLRHLEAHGCPLKHEGGSHSIYWNPRTGRREPVPRHSEIPDLLARKSAARWKYRRHRSDPWQQPLALIVMMVA